MVSECGTKSKPLFQSRICKSSLQIKKRMVPDQHLRVCRPNSGVKFFVEVGEKPDRPFLFILFGVLQNPKSTTVQLRFAFHDADDVQKRDGVFVFSFYQVQILVVVANYPRVFAYPN